MEEAVKTSEIRGWDNNQLTTTLSGTRAGYTPFNVVIMLDEMAHRKLPDEAFDTDLPAQLALLPADRLAQIEIEEEGYSRKTIHFAINELLRRDFAPKIWYYGEKGQSYGPVNRNELYTLAQKGYLTADAWIWREDWEDWQKSIDYADLGKHIAAAASQRAQQTQQGVPPQPPNTHAVPRKKVVPSSLSFAAVIQFVTVPLWLVTAIAQLFNGKRYGDDMEGLAFLWCLILSGTSVAIGVGLLKASKWAYYLTFSTLVCAILYLFYMLQGADFWTNFWLLFIALELTVLAITISNGKAFND